ncbi:hypothetical protein H5410_006149 [Solanum commersonii]|uniref:CCZ1/INTU/HSP4 first Longin domain-containing protein n=1 Tax=Solanum commersonii TaxID=4109 RepID=A0A9J6A9H8_SOLCO|nr:hypothetical protein H5410_006149 [Solanum commersonii]
MGISAASSVSEAMKLCIFDLRRGQHEGQELDKILYFFPADLPFPTQHSVIGLSEGLITFTRIFSPEAPCEVIEAEMHSHVFYEAERDIWMVMVVEKSESEAIWRTAALRSVLKEVHSLFVMFHGSIRALLDREPSGGLTRTHLYYFIMDYLSDFLSGKKLHLPNFRDSLKERGVVQMLTIGREAALEVQSLLSGKLQCVRWDLTTTQFLQACGDLNFKKFYFKFENWWMRVEGFKEEVKLWWQRLCNKWNPGFVLAEKLKLLQGKMKE